MNMTGSSDCCGTCEFNAMNMRDGGRPEERSFRCEIRQLDIDSPFWTLCHNHPRRNPLLSRSVRGPLWAASLGGFRLLPLREGVYLPPEARPPQELGRYTYLPYYGTVRPLESDWGACVVCGEELTRTISLRPERGQPRLCFCSAAHYVEWWLNNAPDAERFRERRPVAEEVLLADLVVLGEELGKIEEQMALPAVRMPETLLDKKALLDVLRGLEGALVQASGGYVDLARAEKALRQGGEGFLALPLLRSWVGLAQIGDALREEPINLRTVRMALRGIREVVEWYVTR